MADVWNIALVTFMLIAALHVKNPAFVTSDTIGLSIEGKELGSNKDSLIVSSLWNSRGGKFTFRVRSSRRNLFALLILMCGDVEPCPGPINQQDCRRSIPELDSLLQKTWVKDIASKRQRFVCKHGLHFGDLRKFSWHRYLRPKRDTYRP